MSAKYRTSSKKSMVDESLFASGPRQSSGNVAVVSTKKYADIQALVGDSASICSSSELSRMKETASGNLGQIMAQKAEEQANADKILRAKERKQKMMEMEAERKLSVPPTDVEVQKAREKAALLSSSERQMAEELDDVKKMNQMMLYSKVVTIRDAQLNEKKVIQKERLEEERRLDTVMEVERLKALKMFEEREARRKADQKTGAAVIIRQMQDRERERVRQLELQDMERDAMLAQNETMKQEELEQQRAKKVAGAKLLEEVALSNAEQIRLKKREKEQLKDEERRIAAYIRDKDMRDQARTQELEAIKAEKERETARLRAMQEKMADKQAELDALRAKRAAEEAERQWRRSQQVAAERESAIQSALDTAREAQKLEKERRLIEQAQQEKEEFSRILRVQREAEASEAAEKSRRAAASRGHMEELQAQIVMNAEVRKKNRMEFLDEGVQQRSRMEADRLRLESIKAEKLASLQSCGVPEKYVVDLANKKFS